MRAIGAAVALLVLTGCSAAPDTGDVSAAAGRFAASTPEQACGLLAPDTLQRLERDRGDCATELARLALPQQAEVLAVEVDGLSAQARLREEVLFLARFPQGWLVTAAGCSREPGSDPAEPYECEVAP